MRLFTSAKYLFPEVVDGKVRLKSIKFDDYIYVTQCRYVDRDSNQVYYVTSEGVFSKEEYHTGSVV